MQSIHKNTLADQARHVRELMGSSGPPQTNQDEVLQIPSRDMGRNITVHLYRGSKPYSPTPVLINFHGSGFVVPMHGSDDEYALRVSKDTPYTVLDVKYRLAPEDPFPAAPNDAQDVVKWVLARPEQFDRERVSVSGFSAGGNLALGLAGHTFPQGTFRHALLFYPPVDLATDPSTKVAPDTSGKPIPAEIAKIFNACYAPSPPLDRTQPLLSPAFISGNKFPDKVLVITCACDTLCLEAEVLAEKVKATGKSVVHRRLANCNHAWDKEYQRGTVQEKAKDDAYDLAVEMLGT
ncbi:Nn.00g066200.m01.CDS01 [Neocucurbitaria sp. VM-36]